MLFMTKNLNFLWVVLLVACTFCFAQDSRKTSNIDSSGKVARGRYIVEGVARCGQCHTPVNSDGTSDDSRELEGAAVWIRPVDPSANWPLLAPRIAGTLPANDQDMVRLLTTGVWTDGKHLRAPMPQFRMTTDDAEAVVAFLKSLSPAQ
jgi:hypothetical protein